MTLANLRVIKDEQTTEEMAPATEPSPARFKDWTTSEPVPIRKARHLDVDRVLERSLPKAVDE